MPMPSMGAMFLVPTGILSALIARETTGRGQHVRTSLFQGALLYTTQIWTWVPGAAGFYGTMAKTYPPGVHQEMIFEVADQEYVHASVMSGLAPVKTQDAPRARPSDPEKHDALPEERAEPPRTPRRKQRRADGLAEFRENNHAIEAIDRWNCAGCQGRTHPQLVANDMIATVDDLCSGTRRRSASRFTSHHTRRNPRTAAQPGQHNEEIFGYSAGDIAKPGVE
jgi:crotonobetainyl-CoA:carnitine CoA-transferase CaiB-like acyl-CoA transferase